MFDSEAIKSVADMTRVQARASGDAIALQFAERRTSYRELDDRASQIANRLIALGVAPGARVGFLGKNSDLFFEILLGAAKARAALAPVNWRLAEPEIIEILNDSGCKVLFVDALFLGHARAVAAQCPAIRDVIVLGGHEEGFVNYGTWRDGASRSDPQLSTEPDDDVVLLYTSGTTGLPKGVQLTNENFRIQLRLASEIGACDYAPGEASLVVMPVFHIAGVNMGLFALSQGARAIVMSEVDPQAILRLIEEERIVYAFIVPAVILSLLQQPNAKSTRYESLKLITYGASPIAEHVLSEAHKTFGCGFLQLYGLTETTGGVCYLPPQDHQAGSKRLRSCGIPYPETKIRVVDAYGKSLAPGEVGEVVIRSPVVMKGYWNKPQEIAKAIEGGWFRTGDAGYFDEDGYLYIHDRVKDMIVSGGENVYPAEVENALFGHPAIADVAVIGVPDEKWGEAVKAIVVLKPGATATAEELSIFARKSIAGYKVPKSFDMVAALPRNPSGKVLRRDLRAPYWRGRDRQIA
jgi:fatty-acyl-CoA synthase